MDQICEVGSERAPLEACGIVTPDSEVIELPNLSPTPDRAYQLDPVDLVHILTKYVTSDGEIPLAQFVVWHTHPSGLIGPSKGDMNNRIEGFRYLVVTLPTGEASEF